MERLGNLMDNAFKWARRRVRVDAERGQGRLRMTVEDDGPGIPPGRSGRSSNAAPEPTRPSPVAVSGSRLRARSAWPTAEASTSATATSARRRCGRGSTPEAGVQSRRPTVFSMAGGSVYSTGMRQQLPAQSSTREGKESAPIPRARAISEARTWRVSRESRSRAKAAKSAPISPACSIRTSRSEGLRACR